MDRQELQQLSKNVSHPKEIWKPACGYEKYLLVSNLGNVKRLGKYIKTSHHATRYCKETIAKPSIGKRGYYNISLQDKEVGLHKLLYIHRLVALTFIPNPKGYRYINHKDENKLNNTVENLEWCTDAYNIHYGTAIQRGKDKQIRDQIRGIPIIQLDKDNNVIAEYPSARHVARLLRYKTSSSIINVLKNRKKTTHGYKWKYKS